METKPTVEVVLAPNLYKSKLTKEPFNVVIVDIFRATTSICGALDYGIKAIIPVKRIRHARFLKRLGFTVAAERSGHKVKFAHLGNSATDFFKPSFKGKEIVYSTTNGTKAIKRADKADKIIIGSFINLNAVAKWLNDERKNVVVFCAGWKNKINMEDSLFAGALSELLITNYGFITDDDSTKLSIDQWYNAKSDIFDYIEKSSHRKRLRNLVNNELLKYTFSMNKSTIVPLLKGHKIIPDKKYSKE